MTDKNNNYHKENKIKLTFSYIKFNSITLSRPWRSNHIDYFRFFQIWEMFT